MTIVYEVTPGAMEAVREWRFDIEDFNTSYAFILDTGQVEQWPAFFTEDALYRITGRENADANLPVGVVYCEGMGMLRDRALAIAKTMMFAPRYLRHQITNVSVMMAGADMVHATANYSLYETLVDEPTKLLQVGQYRDLFVRRDGRLLLKERHVIYDSLTIDTALIYPV